MTCDNSIYAKWTKRITYTWEQYGNCDAEQFIINQSDKPVVEVGEGVQRN